MKKFLLTLLAIAFTCWPSTSHAATWWEALLEGLGIHLSSGPSTSNPAVIGPPTNPGAK